MHENTISIKKSSGMVLGKFYPPHIGHQYLISFAHSFVDDLYVVIEEIPGETISAKTRKAWLESLFPSSETEKNITFIILKDHNPQDPSEHKDFWRIWENSLRRALPTSIDFVFASENYGTPLAECLGATFIPVDPKRERYNICATQIRESPYKHWSLLTTPVKHNFQKSICICGPESTGKSTLSQWLTTELNKQSPLASLIPEYARTYLENTSGEITTQGILNIARGQKTNEELAIDEPRPLKIIDTGVKASSVWNKFLCHQENPELEEICDNTHYDLYLLCAPDIPWIKDDVRFLPEKSWEFFECLKAQIEKERKTPVIIEGNYKKRHKTALDACKKIIAF